jgi:cellobiose phosphorylase
MFRAVIEYFAGIKPDYHGFRIVPCLPTEWERIRVRRPLRGHTYEIDIRRAGDGYRVTIDGDDTEAGVLVRYRPCDGEQRTEAAAE